MNEKKVGASLEETLTSASFPSDPQMSPDGRRVAWFAAPYSQEGEHPEGAIWLAPADGSGQGRQFTFSQGRDHRPRWSPDGQSLAFLSDRVERGTNALYVMPVDGGEARELVKRRAGIVSFEWSPDGSRLAFSVPDDPTEEDERRKKERDDADVYGERWQVARLHVVDFDSGDVTSLPSGDRHVTHFSWSPDSASIAWMSQPTPEVETRRLTEIFAARVGDGEPTSVCQVRNWTADSLCWTTDGSWLVYLGAHESTLSAITACGVDPTGGEPRIVGPTAEEDVCADGLLTVPQDPRAVLLVARGLTTSLEWLDPASGTRESLYEPNEGDISHEFSAVVSRDRGPVVAVIHSTGSQPPEVHVGPPGLMNQVSDHHATLREFTVGTQEPFFWTSPDGLELDGVLLRPPAADDGPLPTVLQIHGGPYGRYTMGWNLQSQWLAVQGYAVLMPNYRSGQGRGNAFAKWAHGGVGDMEFGDIMAGVDTAIERGIADPDRLGIGGWSQGGFLTAWAVTQTNRFKAGVMGAGVSDWGMMVMTSDIPTVESMLGGGKPWDGAGPHRFMQHSPISYARNVETPLLILHGQEDARVPVSQAIGFHRALREVGVEAELVTYPREPHGIRERNHQLDMLRRIRGWFLQHL